MNDEKAALATIDAVYEAWTRNDAAAFAARFLDDATSVMPGVYRAGAAEIGERMAESFAGPLKDSHVDGEYISVRFPAEGTAVVTARNAIVFAGEEFAGAGEVPEGRWVVATWTLIRANGADGEWKVAAYHNSPA
ncbi:hypothetical protein Afil01_58530 [Actinorhabdospora filicis]|uniref:DUF4440 domain-containing protein n=1 Tax=Actinorhabdospora filicis TaxID=1785913 RepID=A0A9W6SRJ5_9ACTN|nr:SgcJ/EcaC family oxidoreductase [Actinorhabdospora filicis]GLZ81046.1 hypothetical protein Afil01_58530 [Actinorhabdospora filicis]